MTGRETQRRAMALKLATRARSAWRDARYLMSRKVKAYYIGWFTERNLGDEALFAAYRKLFGTWIHFRHNETHGALLRLLGRNHSPFDICFLGGGTLINRGARYLRLFTTVKARRRVVFGTGVANPEFWESVEGSYSDIPGWVDALSNADYLGVRGPVSRDLLGAWGVRSAVKLIGDPVLALGDASITRKAGRKVIGVNLGVSNNLVWGFDEGKLERQVVSTLRDLQACGWTIKFFPVCPQDLACIERACDALACDSHDTILQDYLSVASFKEAARSCDVFIGMKLHSVVLAVCAGTPAVMLEYRPKCRDFMRSIAMEGLNVRCDRIEPTALRRLVESVYSRRDEVQADLHKNCDRYRQLLMSEAEHLKAICRPVDSKAA